MTESVHELLPSFEELSEKATFAYKINPKFGGKNFIKPRMPKSGASCELKTYKTIGFSF